MPRTSSIPALGLLLPTLAAAAFACTTTTIIEEPSKPSGTTPTADGGTGTTANPLEGLAPDWRAKAAKYLDGRASSWLTSPPNIANIKCAMSCHTTFPTLLARTALGDAPLAAADTARTRFEARVTERAAGSALPMYGKNGDAKTVESHATEAVLNATALSLDDLGKGGTVAASTKSALDAMWKEQRADGAWDWLEFGLEPWETRTDWGTAMAALVAGSVPEGTSSAQAAGTAKLTSYLKGRLTKMAFHDRVVVLWASSKLTSLLSPDEASSIADELAAKQLDDGGFALGSFGKGDLAATASASDGYATSLAVLALCTGAADGKKRPDVAKGLAWIAKNQQADGSWPGQSVNSDSARAKGFMTDAATAYAALAITSCVPSAK